MAGAVMAIAAFGFNVGIALAKLFKICIYGRSEGTPDIKTFEDFVEQLEEASHFIFSRGKQ